MFRSPSNYANGNARDRQGRLVSCEHSVTRRITRTEKDGKITVLADKFEGKRLNAPNDIVVKSDDSIWFTDPLFGINGEWEGKKEKPEQATTNVYRIAKDGKITAVITDIVNPNGLAFSPDEKKLYVVEWKGTPNRSIWGYDVNADGTLGSRTKIIDAADQGALDGFRVDRDGNLWCGWGSNGALQGEPTDVGGRKVFQLKGKSEDLDGVMVFNPEGKPLAFIRLPERCANLTFGGPKNNRLYMTSLPLRLRASTWKPTARCNPSFRARCAANPSPSWSVPDASRNDEQPRISTMTKLSDATRNKLKTVSTATVATALFKRGFRIQMIQDVHPLGPDQPTLVGEAFTLRYMPAREDLNKIDVFRDRGHPQRKAIEDCPPGAVLVMDSRKDARAASAGAILVTRLMQRGAPASSPTAAFAIPPKSPNSAFPPITTGRARRPI